MGLFNKSHNRANSSPSTRQQRLQSQPQDIMPPRPYGWGKLLLFLPCVLIPAVGVGISNYTVFEDSFWLATLLLAATVIVAAIFNYYSGDATPKVRRYCLIADIIICVVLCVTLGSHFILARQVSAAKQGTAERYVEEDRAEMRAQAEAERQTKLITAQRDLEREQTKRFNAEAWRNREARRLGMTVRPNSLLPGPAPSLNFAPSSPPAPSTESQPKAARVGRTPAEVREWWNPWLIGLAFLECFASVLAGAVLIGLWEWDKNHNGIPDHLEKQQIGFNPQQQPLVVQPLQHQGNSGIQGQAGQRQYD